MATAVRIREIAEEIAAQLSTIPDVDVTAYPRESLFVEHGTARGCIFFMGSEEPETMGLHVQPLQFALLLVLPSTISGDIRRANERAQELAAVDETTSIYGVLNGAALRSQARVSDVEVDYWQTTGEKRSTQIQARIDAWG